MCSSDLKDPRALAAAIAIGLLSAGSTYFWHRSLASPKLPEFDLSRAGPKVKSTIENARNAVRTWPRSSAAWGELGELYEAHDFHQEALVCLAQAARIDPHEFLWPYLCGDIQNVRNQSEAERWFRQAARTRPRLALPQVRLAELLLEQRRLDAAAVEFQAALRIEPDDARALFGMGLTAFYQGDLAQAGRWAGQSFARAPEHRKTAELLLRIAFRSGDKAAIDRQQAVLNAMPKKEVIWDDPFAENVKLKRRHPAGLAATASEMLESGRLPAAISVCERLVESDPENPQWHSLLATTLIRHRDFTRATQVLEAGLVRHSQSAELHFHRGVVHFFMEEWMSAASEFRRALTLKPDFRDARYNLGHTLVKLGDRDGAILEFREAVRYRPDDGPSYANLGKLLAESGDRDAARDALEIAARLAPHDAAIKQSLKALQNGEEQ